LEQALQKLSSSQLSVMLIPPSKMQNIHETVEKTLVKENSDYELLFTDVMEYYNLKEVSAVYYGDHIVITIPMPLRLKTLPILDLFHVDIVYMPYNVR
jgi:hypothetical protein